MLLKKLKLQNFKKFQEKEFEFKEINKVYGKNGEGKSTIKDAVFFCFYGRTSEGSLPDATKYIRNGEAKCMVEIEFEKDGQDFKVRRERTEKQTRITFIDGSQSEDDSVITQRELESIVPDYELMQCVFNCGYFMALPDKDKREFLLRLTPDIDKKKLYLKLGGTEELAHKYGFNWFDIDSEHKKLLKINRENNDELVKAKAIIEDSKETEIPKNEFTDRSAELKEEKERYKKWLMVNQDWYSYEQRMDSYNKTIERNKALQLEIDKPLEEVLEPSKDNLNQLIAQKNECKTTIHIPEGKCPTCLQDISGEHQDKVARVNLIRSTKILELTKSINAEAESYSKKLEEYQKYVQANNEKQTLKNSIQIPLKPEKPTEEKFEYDSSKERECETLQRNYENRLAEIKLLTRQEEDRKDKIERLREKVTFLVGEINEVNNLLPIFSKTGIPALEMRRKLDPILEEIKKVIPTAEIELLETLKNGIGEKEVFTLMSNGIEYDKCSTGEKMKVNCAISQIIDNLSGNKINMTFLDNGESVDEVPEMKGQCFIAKVTNNSLELL